MNLLIVFCSLFFSTVYSHPLRALFEDFKLRYNKTYEDTAESDKRFQIFIDNHAFVGEHGQNETFVLKINHYGDWTHDEFKETLRGYDQTVLQRTGKRYDNFTNILMGRLPSHVDWVEQKKVTRVKDQEYCGGCWAFAVVDAIESRFAISHKTHPVELSVQEQLDCNHNGVNQGCTGGNLPEGFDYVIDAKGLCLAQDYKFQGDDSKKKCHKRRSRCQNRSGQIRNYGIVYPYDEKALKKAVAQGPVAIAIEADDRNMQFYSKGIFKSKGCGKDVDHAMTIVGYGEVGRSKYWKIKGTWSDNWGEKGYIRLCRECGRNGRAGECGVAVEAVFPII